MSPHSPSLGARPRHARSGRIPLTLSLVAFTVAVAGTGGGCVSDSGADSEKPTVTVAMVAQLEAQRGADGDFDDAVLSPSPAVRARTALALARLERLDTASHILQLLKDPDAAVRRQAAFAAGQLDLALTAGLGVHDALRSRVATALVTLLSNETDPETRLATIRALGRLGGAGATVALLGVAGGQAESEAVTALFALGVAEARRPDTLVANPQLAPLSQLVLKRLQTASPDLRTAAAYAAFRLKIPLDDLPPATIAALPDQAQIFVARALGETGTTAAGTLAATLLKVENWGARVETLRVLGKRPELAVDDVFPALKAAAVAVAKPGEAFVVKEACLTLAQVGAPSVSLPIIEQALVAIPDGNTFMDARCTCAGTVVGLGGPAGTLGHCVAKGSEAQQSLLIVDGIRNSRLSSLERVARLTPMLTAAIPAVRMEAASALCGDEAPTGLDVVATHMVQENDPGVLEAMAACFDGGVGQGILRDNTIARAVDRLVADSAGKVDPQRSEPLRILASLAATRPPSPTLDAVLAQLRQSPDGRVRDAANGVRHGEREPGPRAVVMDEPSIATLPLAAVLHTSRGEITIAFEREIAPRTVENFLELTQQGVLNGTPFHRVIGDFVAQGGDPRGDGTGGPGYFIPCENNDASFTRGAIGMATSGKDTGGSQFFLTHSHQPHLDGRYTLFARVTKGLDVMDMLQRDDRLLNVEVATALRPSAQP